MQAMPYTGGVGVLLRDHGVGEVRTGRDGEPVVRYKLRANGCRAHAPRRARRRPGGRGYGRAARVLVALGLGVLEPGARGDVDDFMRQADACGWGAGQAQMVSFHIMGSARIGDSPIDSVCDPTGEVWSTPGLYVMDGAAFPTASGVNPMVTIEALSHMNARRPGRKAGRGCLKPAPTPSSSGPGRTAWRRRSCWQRPAARCWSARRAARPAAASARRS